MQRKMSWTSLVAVIALAVAACPAPEQQPAPPADQPATPTTAPPAMSPEQVAALPPGVTAEMISQGQQLYGTVCVACHGAGGIGSPLGPALNDQNWIHITGEFEDLVNIINIGVMQPQQYPAPMPAQGGGNFTPEQVRAISAYVYAISHGS